jgi:hypothetical protein
MKKSDLKRILKPLIRECVKEVILDEGVLAGVISEVAVGLTATHSTAPPIVEQADPVRERLQQNAFSNKQNSTLKQQKQQLMQAVGRQAYNGVDLFEGTTPAPAQGSVTQPGGDPSHAGVDISSLFGSVGKNWNAHMDNVKEDTQ